MHRHWRHHCRHDVMHHPPNSLPLWPMKPTLVLTLTKSNIFHCIKQLIPSRTSPSSSRKTAARGTSLPTPIASKNHGKATTSSFESNLVKFVDTQLWPNPLQFEGQLWSPTTSYCEIEGKFSLLLSLISVRYFNCSNYTCNKEIQKFDQMLNLRIKIVLLQSEIDWNWRFNYIPKDFENLTKCSMLVTFGEIESLQFWVINR